jgi:hypothetical protein
MLFKRKPNPYWLIAGGLLVMLAYPIIMRFPHPEILSNDFVRGVWHGLGLGLGILGGILILKAKKQQLQPSSGHDGP